LQYFLPVSRLPSHVPGVYARSALFSKQYIVFSQFAIKACHSLFGSVLRDDFKPTSDIDVLVEFESGKKIGLFKIAHMERELSDLMGRKVDLRTPLDLSRCFRQEVLENAGVQYAEG